MERELQIRTHHVELPAQAEELIKASADKLERYYDRLIGCSVVVEGPSGHHRNGGPYRVGIDLRVPGAEPLVVSRKEEATIEAAIQAAFQAARRQLEDFSKRQKDR